MTGLRPTVLIAGHGQMGQAFEALLRGRATIELWEVAPGRTALAAAEHAAAARAEFVFLCVPTQALAPVLAPLSPALPAATATISIAKGLDDTGLCAAGILQRACGSRPWGVLGGPMIANEIIAGKAAFAELGSHDETLPGRVQALFPQDRLKLTGTPNPQAVSWCGVLKNIYAPLLGISDGLGWGDNTRGHIIMAAVDEMQAIVRELTGDAAWAYGDAGLADLIATVTSPSSHHYALGRRVAGGDYGNLECEGVHSLQALAAGGRLDAGKYKLYGVAKSVLMEPYKRPGQALHDWLTTVN